MRFLVVLIWLTAFQNLLCQSFKESYQFPLPQADQIIKMQWADINNDSLLDVVVGYKKGDSLKISVIVNNLEQPWLTQDLIKVPFINNASFYLSDENKDNRLDITILGSEVRQYWNSGNFIFEWNHSEWGSSEIPVRALQLVDLNNDTALDTIWVDESAFSIVNHKDSLNINVSSFSVTDFDNNGFKDIAFSGLDNMTKPFTFIWYFGDDFSIIKREKVANIFGQLATGDLNHDGFFDLVLSGKTASGELKTVFYNNFGQSLMASDSTLGLDSASVLIADFTSDGYAEVALRGKNSSGNYLNWIRTLSGDTISLPSENLISQDFGDYDRDGDLDWAQIANDSLRIFNNTTNTANKGPAKPASAIGLQIYEQMFFYWEKSLDDHSPSNSITYDLKIFNNDSTLVAADFDEKNRHRLLVSHGNAGTSNFALLKLQGNYSFEIQAIDNAFVPNVKSICSGVCSTCTNVDEQDVLACGEPVKLTPAAPGAMWFSFKRGFVGIGDWYEFDEVGSDTVFSFNPSANASCANLRVFNIKAVPANPLKLSHTLYDCIDKNITLEATPGWDDVSWKNNLNNTVVVADSLIHPFTKEITFTASATSKEGCILEEEFILKISKPNLQVNGNQFRIMYGSSVQLVANGGDLYEWKPASYLNDNQIADPIADPVKTIEYTVTAYDTLGCTSEAKILVEVFEEAFIPTLFTPNADGKNDNLRIYGLTQANDFHFAIYNREGSKLFETTSVDEATNIGWTGSVKGTHQPPGTYYWKVEGRAPQGELLLNGKKSGVILLVR
jgi:gliding motility-associated-like protein